MPRESEPMRQALHMSINDESRLSENMAEDHVSSLSPHAVEFDELLHLGRHFAAVLFNQRLTGRD